MATKTSRRIKTQLPRTGPGMTDNANTVELDVYYAEGGLNYFSGGREPRGIYVSALPVEVRREGDFTTTSFMVGTNGGFRVLVKPLPRFNNKVLAEAAATLAPSADRVADLLAAGDRSGAATAVKEVFA